MTNSNIGKARLIDGEAYQVMPDGSLVPAVGRTDYARLDAMTDEEVTAAAESDPDALPMTDEEWANAVVFYPGKQRVGIRLDTDVLQWFQARGRGYQTRINAVLRRYMEAQQKAG
jgi:uncharacterized protein (DUF4415 family)